MPKTKRVRLHITMPEDIAERARAMGASRFFEQAARLYLYFLKTGGQLNEQTEFKTDNNKDD